MNLIGDMRVACVIPTYNSVLELERLLKSLERQRLKFDIVVIDSSSNDGTLELAKLYVENVSVIPTARFNHGGTRQQVIVENSEYDIYVFLTQDAYLPDADALMHIVASFSTVTIGAVCGRQLPHLTANPFAQHARLFNYPKDLQVKSISDIPQLGIKAAFMSNSFAAYRASALHAVGGFPSHVIFAEDMYVAAKMLLAGWKVAYAGNALARHSHNYSVSEEFRRYFDMGVFHAREPWIRQTFGGAGGEGVRYVKSELKFLGWRRLHLWPGALLRNALKLIAYKLGQQEAHLPIALKKRIGMHKRYWDGPFAEVPDQHMAK